VIWVSSRVPVSLFGRFANTNRTEEVGPAPAVGQRIHHSTISWFAWESTLFCGE
jgi:hypothetical protein